MKKKLLSLVLALVMSLGLCVPAFAGREASANVPQIGMVLPNNSHPESSTGSY